MVKQKKVLTDRELSESFLARVANLFFDGLFVMLAFGVAHGTSKGVPAFGYWQSLFFGWVLSGLASTGTATILVYVKKIGQLVNRAN